MANAMIKKYGWTNLAKLGLYTLLIGLQMLTGVFLVVSLVNMGILRQNYIVVICVILLALLAFNAMVLFRRKSARALRVICIILSVAVSAVGIFALRYTNAFNGFLDKITSIEAVAESDDESGDREVVTPGKKVTEDPFVMYISGSDSHDNVDDPTARSDVNILVVVNPTERKILLASIPRDIYVQLHGTTGLMDKLTHAGLGMYGPDMSRATLEDFLGISIDYTVKVSFDTVVGVVDQLDGIDIYSDAALSLNAWAKNSPNKYCYFKVGVQHVDGDCALRFARERKSYARGDKHRGENQQEVLTGIINKLSSSRDYVLKLPEILEIAGDSFRTSFSRDDITDFIRFQLQEQVNWQVEPIGLDGVGDMLPTYTYGEGTLLWVMLPDEDSLAEVKNKINTYLTNNI